MSQNASSAALTIRNIPEPVQAAIRARAERDRTSLDKAVLSLLEDALAKHPETPTGPPYHDLDDLFGSWTAEEADEFDQALREQRRIDLADWN